MTIFRLAARSLVYYRRTHAAVIAGVAGAVAVLAGSLLVGASVTESLHTIAASRLGAADVVIGAPQPFTEALAGRLASASHAVVAPMMVLTGTALHEPSGRRAGQINVYGVDGRFFALHGVTADAPTRSDAWLSPDLTAELGAAAGDALVVRIARPTDIPLDSLHGRRDEAGRSMRLAVKGELARDQMGEFSLGAGQGPARAVFVPLARLQRDLAIDERVNTLILGKGAGVSTVRDALASTVRLADFGVTVDAPVDATGHAGALIVESKSGLIPDAIADRVSDVAAREGWTATPVLTWLANQLMVNDLTVPYSLVTAIGPDAAGDPDLARLLTSTGEQRAIVLNEWAARELRVETGSTLTLDYFRWADEGRLITERADFQVAGVVPMRGVAIDRRLAPDYPGITTATDLTDWDPPFPIDLKLVRPQDEAYWDQYKTAPKAFISLDAGQAIWRTRHGSITSIRLRPQPGASGAPASASTTPESIARFTEALERAISPDAAGFSAVDVRTRNVTASSGATDFGAYFSYFSFFLMVSALLLSALFFRLSVEQRLPQIGVLRATGFRLADVRRLLLLEAAIVVLIGAAIGAALAVGWAALMMFALRTWWVEAVGTTLLRLHVDPMALIAGAAGAAVAALAAIAWTVRLMSRTSPRAQLAGHTSEPVALAPAPAGRRWLAVSMVVAAAIVSALSFAGLIPAAGGFFGAGALVLAGGLAWFGLWLSRSDRLSRDGAMHTVSALGLRNAAWRPGRSLVVAGLVAAAVFLLVSVDSFRKTAALSSAPDSGTGGFSLLAESALPIVHDLNAREGREAAGFAATPSGDPFSGSKIFGFRLRPGDDASCLNLYQPKQPRMIGVSEAFVREGRFRFAKTIDAEAPGRENPWTMLGPADADGVIPAIVDATSLQYVLHKSVGDVISIDEESSRPLRLRIVASLDDSVLQGEIMIAESAFRQVFPEIAGYRVFLIALADASPGKVDDISRQLEEGLDAFGFDAQETARRLEAFHRVENTYLSTFQALGGLGLVLGCLSLVAVVLRNVLERRRELALLGAAGFTGRDLQRLVAIEHASLVLVGLVIGLAAAAVAVAPVVIARSGGLPWHALVWLLPVAAAGLLASAGATRALRRLPLVASLRSE